VRETLVHQKCFKSERISNRKGYGGAGIRTWHLQDLKLEGCLAPGEHLQCNCRPRDGKGCKRSENLNIGDQNLQARVCGEICINVTCAVCIYSAKDMCADGVSSHSGQTQTSHVNTPSATESNYFPGPTALQRSAWPSKCPISWRCMQSSQSPSPLHRLC